MGGVWLGGSSEESGGHPGAGNYRPPHPPSSVAAAASPASTTPAMPATMMPIAPPPAADPEPASPTEADAATALRKIGSSASAALSDGASPPTTLHASLRALDDLDCAALASLLSPLRLPCLTSVNLSHNSLGDGGAIALGRALAGGAPALSKLWLHENAIGCAGMEAVAQAMRPAHAPAIVELRINFNRIGDRGAAGLGCAWAEGGCRSLREVHAAANQIGSAGLSALVEHLHAVPELTRLDLGSALGGNLIADAGANALSAALRMNAFRTLTVRLTQNPRITTMAAQQLLQTARECGPEVKVQL